VAPTSDGHEDPSDEAKTTGNYGESVGVVQVLRSKVVPDLGAKYSDGDQPSNRIFRMSAYWAETFACPWTLPPTAMKIPPIKPRPQAMTAKA
jgi:hypothetical protein